MIYTNIMLSIIAFALSVNLINGMVYAKKHISEQDAWKRYTEDLNFRMHRLHVDMLNELKKLNNKEN